jgi:prolyl-tRNA synthetase
MAAVLTPQTRDFPQWYQDVLAKAELAENGPVRGTMVIRPYGYALWERIQAEVDRRIKAAGAENVYFPLFIPEDHLRREAEHVEGFSPELAVVTHAGGKPLAEPVVVRPTSETVFGEYMAKWVQSYRDLPLLLNQWANVVRWELRPRVFLRTSEFLWQEGHTAHATREDAARYARLIHDDVYLGFLRDVLALPVEVGIKTEVERFAGAINTLTCEVMMRDGKALQMATSHELGQNFARAFDITFLDQDGQRNLVWTTSWGMSTRILGGMLMMHGDNSGLILPPRVAPIQVILVPIPARSDEDTNRVSEAVSRVLKELTAAGVRAEADWTDKRPGWKFNEWELKGVPLRLEVGPRDLANDHVTLVRRDTRAKEQVALPAVTERVQQLLGDVQKNLYERALAFREANTHVVRDYDEFKSVMQDQRGFIRAYWCGSADCEARIKEETRATIRVVPEDAEAAGPGVCIYDGQPARVQALFAQAY